MNEQEFAKRLDAWCRELPATIEPQRDLWPDIAARLDGEQAPAASVPQVERLWPFAAGIAATALVALMTILIARGVSDVAPETAQNSVPMPILVVEPQWIPELRRTRNAYERDFVAGLARLAPETRAIVERNLTEIQQSLVDIEAALAGDPGNAALHRLLATTYQRELGLITNIGSLRQTDTEL